MTPSVSDAFERMIVNELILAGEDPENFEKSCHLADTIKWLSAHLVKVILIMYDAWPGQAVIFARALHNAVGKMLSDLENKELLRINAEKEERKRQRPGAARMKLASLEGVVLSDD